MPERKRNPRYYVSTWDTERGEFTPQAGVRTGPYTLFGLRKALRKLKDMGYSCDRSFNGETSDPSVLVESKR